MGYYDGSTGKSSYASTKIKFFRFLQPIKQFLVKPNVMHCTWVGDFLKFKL